MTPKQKQCLLAFLGFYAGEVDGIWGQMSRNATAAFQRAYGIPDDGVFGAQTESRMREVIGNGQEPIAEDKPKENTTTSGLWAGIRYWTPEEMRCRCGEYHAPYCNGFPVQPDRTLLELADDVRAHFGRPGHSTSGIRCKQHNIDSKGAGNSKHLYGKALDFWIEGVSGKELLAYVQRDPRCSYAYIVQDNIVHMDVK